MQVHCASLITLVLGAFSNAIFTNGSKVSRPQISYSFSYNINDGNVITHHSEEKLLDKVQGSYGLLQPDGLARLVQYEVFRDSGFKAIVTYRNPSNKLMGHLQFPKDFQHPLTLAEPVGLITKDFLRSPTTT